MLGIHDSSPERAQEPEVPPKAASPRVEDEEEEEEGAAEEEQEEALLVPQVKVAEDGSLIIDEERSVYFCVKGAFHVCLLPFHVLG